MSPPTRVQAKSPTSPAPHLLLREPAKARSRVQHALYACYIAPKVSRAKERSRWTHPHIAREIAGISD
ncbi:hypothetical protein AN958_00011 [Leucoagaricus sp. SymC.cos]|nr:hypothetical protein AN958_00011 [Leucoagaricus sp. SymC.cos]